VHHCGKINSALILLMHGTNMKSVVSVSQKDEAFAKKLNLYQFLTNE
jgi:hypothetical protein